jgi:hypothetical protein
VSYKIVLLPLFQLGYKPRSEHHQYSHVCFLKHEASPAASRAASACEPVAQPAAPKILEPAVNQKSLPTGKPEPSALFRQHGSKRQQ